MTYSWDENKNRSNRSKHGVDFEAIAEFDWEGSLLDVDDRHDGELREIADGFIGMTLYRVVFTRRGDVIRVISLRKCTKKESAAYANQL